MTDSSVLGGGPEWLLVGIVVHTHHGAQLAASRVQPHDLGDARAREVYEAAIACEATGDRRLGLIARATNTPRHQLEALIAPTPTMWDSAGCIARKVLAARDERLRLAGIVEEMSALSEQLRWDAPDVFIRTQAFVAGWREAASTP